MSIDFNQNLIFQYCTRAEGDYNGVHSHTQKLLDVGWHDKTGTELTQNLCLQVDSIKQEQTNYLLNGDRNVFSIDLTDAFTCYDEATDFLKELYSEEY